VNFLVLPLLLACGEEAGDGAAPANNPAAEPTLEAPKRPASSRVSVKDGRVWLSVRQTRRSEILQELAAQAGFKLVSGRLPAAQLTLAVEDTPLEAVLAQLLAGIDFRVDYRFDSDAGAHVVSRVVAGDPGRSSSRNSTSAGLRTDSQPASPAVAPAATAGDAVPNNVHLGEDASDHPNEDLRRLERWAGEEARTVAQLYSDNASLRAVAVEDVDLDGPGRDRLYEMLEEDPDANVRAAAVERLLDEDSAAVLEQLYAALQDPASVVVRAAIGVLEWVGDEKALPHIEQVVQGHPDPDVRAAADEAYKLLE